MSFTLEQFKDWVDETFPDNMSRAIAENNFRDALTTMADFVFETNSSEFIQEKINEVKEYSLGISQFLIDAETKRAAIEVLYELTLGAKVGTSDLLAQTLTAVADINIGSNPLGEYNAASNTPTLTATPPDSSVPNGSFYNITEPGVLSFAGSNFASGVSVAVGGRLFKKSSTQWYYSKPSDLALVKSLANEIKIVNKAGVTEKATVKNAFIRDEVIVGSYVDNVTFSISSNPGLSRSNYRRVNPGEQFTLSGLGALPKAIQYTDVNQVKLNTTPGTVANTDPFTFIIPANCFFITYNVRVSGDSVVPPSLMIEPGAAATTYEPYKPEYVKRIDGNQIEAAQLAPGSKMGGNLILDTSRLGLQKSINLFNKDDATILLNKAVSSAGAIINFADFSITHYISCVDSAKFTVSGVTGERFVRWETAAGGLAGVTTLSAYPAVITRPTGAVRFITTFKITGQAIPTTMQIEEGEVANAYAAFFVPYYKGNEGIVFEAGRVLPGTKMSGSELVNMVISKSLIESYLTPEIPENIFNLEDQTIQLGKAVNTSGEIASFSNYSLGHYIDCVPGSKITLSGVSGQRYLRWENASGGKVGFNQMDTYPAILTVPSTAVRFIFTFKLSSESNSPTTLKVQHGEAATAYSPYFTPVYKGSNGIKFEAGQLLPGTKMGANTVATTNQIPGIITSLPAGYTKILAVGTSITNRVGSSTGNAWIDILANMLSGVLGRSVSVINGGVSGQTSTGMLNNLPTLLATNTPHVVILETPINDAKMDGNGIARSLTESNFISMISLVRAAGAVPIINTAAPIDMTVTGVAAAFSQAKRSEINATTRKLAKSLQVQLVDLDMYFGNNLTLLGDGLHPNDKGHLHWANGISSVFY